jgi:hypothetical protein
MALFMAHPLAIVILLILATLQAASGIGIVPGMLLK